MARGDFCLKRQIQLAHPSRGSPLAEERAEPASLRERSRRVLQNLHDSTILTAGFTESITSEVIAMRMTIRTIALVAGQERKKMERRRFLQFGSSVVAMAAVKPGKLLEVCSYTCSIPSHTLPAADYRLSP